MAGLRAAVLLPLATVACGDDENAAALRRRGAARQVAVEVQVVHEASSIPEADVYLLGGGGEDIAALVEQLRGSAFERRAREGAVVLAVGAALDALGRGLATTSGQVDTPGLGLLDIVSMPAPLIDGFAVTHPRQALGLPPLVGWVSHSRTLQLGPDVEPFVRYSSGPGAGEPDGAVAGRVCGTRLHGPLLARNPEVADLLLAWATGVDPLSWPALEPGAAEAARAQRIAEEVRPHPSVLARLAAVAGRARP